MLAAVPKSHLRTTFNLIAECVWAKGKEMVNASDYFEDFL